jgi:hypothetical protein
MMISSDGEEINTVSSVTVISDQKFDQEVFDSLSQGLKDQIMQSAEYRNTFNKPDVNKQLQDAAIIDDDLSVPF